jgi:hypothetical protein
MTTTLRDRKDALPRIIVMKPSEDGIALRAIGVRLKVYGRTSPRPGLCSFDAYGMDIIEGRA